MLHLADLLEQDGWPVETLGLRENENVHMERADAVLLPYPFSQKDGLIPVLTGEKINAEDLLAHVPKNAVIIAGKGLEEVVRQESFCVKRYTDAADFEKRNAELSAEAAVCECMLHSRRALMDTKILVTGYGLFGRALALRLKALGAQVWIAARRGQQRAQAENEGMQSVSIVEMAEILPEMDLVLNTIPARIFGEYHLKQLKKSCCLLELASAPYGFDRETTRALGINCMHLPGLPARYSPLSAALALQEAVNELLGRKTV